MKSMIETLKSIAHKLTAPVAGAKHPNKLGGDKNRRIKEYEALFHIASTIAGSASFVDKAKAIVEEIAQTWECDWVTLRLPSEDGQTLRLEAFAGSAVESTPPILDFTEEQTLSFTAFRDRRTVEIPDYAAEPKAAALILALGMRSMVIIPVNVGDRTLGIVTIISRERNWFNAERVEVLTSIVDRLGELLEKSESQEQQKEQRWQTLFNNADDEIFLFGVEDDGRPSRFLEVNDVACERLGYTREELLGMKVVDIVPAEASSEILRNIQKSFAGFRNTFEAVHVSKDGRNIPVEIKSRTIDLAGQRCILSIARDLTLRKEAERSLRDSEENFRALVELSPDAAFVIQDSKISYANPQTAKLFAVAKPEDLIGRNPFDFVPDNHKKGSVDQFAFAQNHSGGLPINQVGIVNDAGEAIEIETNITEITYAGKEAVLVMSRDITERKALKDSEETFRALVELCPDAALVSSDRNIFYANPQAAKLFGVKSPEDLIGMDPADFVYPDDQVKSVNRLKLAQDRPGDLPIRSLRLVSGVGEITEIEANISGITFGGKRAVLAMLRDITERKRAEQALRDSEANFRALVELSPDAALVLIDRIVVYANPQAAKLFGGKTAEDLIGRDSVEFVHQDEDPNETITRLNIAQTRGEEVATRQLKIVNDVGEATEIETNICGIIFGGKSAVLAISRDITERKRAEQALKNSEENFRALVELSPDAALVIQDDKICYANPQAAKLFSVAKPEELIGRDPTEFDNDDDER